MALLRNNCISCHNKEKHKSGLLLTSREAALKGGENGPALVPGKSGQSRLIQNLDADSDPHMPPKKQLTADEIGLLRKWIDAGAPWDEVALTKTSAQTRPVVFHPLPVSYRPVLAIALSSDNHWLASGCGNRVYLHDVSKSTKPMTRVLEGAHDAIQSLAWSKDGKRLAAGDYGRVLIWEIDSDHPPVELTGFTGRVTAMQFLPDGDTLITADGGMASPGRLHRCKVSASEVGPAIPAHTDEILTLALSPDGALLASGGADKTARLWDAPTLKELAKLEGHTGHITSCAFNPEGTLLATGGGDRDVKIWDVKTHEQTITHGPHPTAVTAVAWLPSDPAHILVASEDGMIRLDRSAETAAASSLPAAEDVLYNLAVKGKGDSREIYAGCHDGRVYWWNAGGTVKALSNDAAKEPAERSR